MKSKKTKTRFVFILTICFTIGAFILSLIVKNYIASVWIFNCGLFIYISYSDIKLRDKIIGNYGNLIEEYGELVIEYCSVVAELNELKNNKLIK